MNFRQKLVSMVGVAAIGLGVVSGVSAQPAPVEFEGSIEVSPCMATASFSMSGTNLWFPTNLTRDWEVTSVGVQGNTYCITAPWSVTMSGTDFIGQSNSAFTVDAEQFSVSNDNGTTVNYDGTGFNTEIDPLLNVLPNTQTATLSASSSTIINSNFAVGGTGHYGFPGQWTAGLKGSVALTNVALVPGEEYVSDITFTWAVQPVS